ncbi:redoxin domain-containing protein, partial [Mycobacteroides abscessus]
MNIQFGGRKKFRAQQVRGLTRTVAVVVAVLLVSAGLVRAPSARADGLLDFTGTTVSGAPFNGASLKGKPVVLWFWAAYCPFCNGEGPHVSAVSAANPRVTFVGISGRGSVGEMEAFISRYNLHFTN